MPAGFDCACRGSTVGNPAEPGEDLAGGTRRHESTHELDDLLPVDGVVQRLPHSDIVEGRHSRVQEHVVRPRRRVAVEPAGMPSSGAPAAARLAGRTSARLPSLDRGELRLDILAQVEADLVGIAIGSRILTTRESAGSMDQLSLLLGVEARDPVRARSRNRLGAHDAERRSGRTTDAKGNASSFRKSFGSASVSRTVIRPAWSSTSIPGEVATLRRPGRAPDAPTMAL